MHGGFGGPGPAVHTLATRWSGHRFAATAPVHFAVPGITSLAMKGAVLSLHLTGRLVLGGALGAGLIAGNLLARRIDGAKAIRGVIVIAAVGAVLALIQGIRSL